MQMQSESACSWGGICTKLYSDSLFSVVLDDFFQYNSKIVDNGKDNLEIGIKEVCFDNVTFSYKEMVPILNKVSFIARQGERIAVVGQNGAGKSTLMKVLLRLYEPDSGDIFINGRTYKSIHLDSLYREIAVVSQQVNMYSCTIAENILMRECRNSEDERIVLNALEKVGLYDRIIKLPLGINTYIYNRFDEDGVLLSGGELQKLAIARAIAKNSSILVLDEPTSSLDSLSEQQLLSFFNSECSDKILIIISHKLSLIKDFSKIIVLEDGMVVEQGIHDELMSNNGVYYKMWNT